MRLIDEVFHKIPLFSKISPDEVKKISLLAKVYFYKKGTTFLQDSQVQNTFLYVIKGWAKLFRESAEGEEIIVDILTAQHYCGEQFIFQGAPEENYTIQALSDIEVITLPLQTLKQLIQLDHQLTLNLLEETLRKQQHLNMQIEHLSIQNALQRVGCFILRLCSLEDGNTVKIRLPYDKFLLATRLGMRAETFSRALLKLAKQCDLDIDMDMVHVRNIKKLASFVCKQCSRTFPCKDIMS